MTSAGRATELNSTAWTEFNWTELGIMQISGARTRDQADGNEVCGIK